MRKLTKRSAVIAGAAVVAVGGLGVAAFANGWLVNGSGSATATSSEVKAMNADITLNGNVFPGRSLNAVASVDNPNEFPVLLTGLTYTGVEVKKGTADNDACESKLTPNSITPTLPSTSPKITPGNDRIVTIPITIDPNLADECAASTFKVYFDFTGQSTV
jgi:hypothetical protein